MSEAATTSAPNATVETTVTTVPTSEHGSEESTAGKVEPAAADGTAAPSDPASETGTPGDKTKDPSVAKRFEAARAAEMKARRAEEKSISKVRSAEAALETKARAFETERQQWQARLQHVEGRLRDHQAAEEDPIGWALSRVPEQELAARIASFGSPEAKELRAIKARLDAKERAEQEADERRRRADEEHRQRSHHHARHTAMVEFVREITPDECPALTRIYPAHHVPQLVEDALREHGAAFQRANGRAPSNAEIRVFLEQEARKRISNEQATTAANASNGAEQATTGTGHQATNGPRTLTNQLAAQQASGRVAPKTREQRRQELVARLEAERSQRG